MTIFRAGLGGNMPALKTQKILLVDDEQELCEALGEYLVDEGYDICCAHNGEDAIRLFHSFHPDIVLLDVRMPKLDGLSALRNIRSESSIPVIMMTALGDRITAEECMNSGAQCYLVKPIDLVELDDKLCDALHVA